jgi:hypothetical protein
MRTADGRHGSRVGAGIGVDAAREPRVLRLLAAGLGAALQATEVLVELGAAGVTAAVRRVARSSV